MSIESEILNLPILKGNICRDSPLFHLLKNNNFLISDMESALKPLELCDSIHDAIIEECLEEKSVAQVQDKLAKYQVAGIFKNFGCRINEIELKNKKVLKRTDIECAYGNEILLIEVKHINKTKHEEDFEKEAFKKKQFAYKINYRKANLISIPCDDPSIDLVTQDSVEISKLYDYLKLAEPQIADSKTNYKKESYGIVAFVISSIYFHEKELQIAFEHYLNETSNPNVIAATLFIRKSGFKKLIRNGKQNIPNSIISLFEKINYGEN